MVAHTVRPLFLPTRAHWSLRDTAEYGFLSKMEYTKFAVTPSYCYGHLQSPG